jgi:putative MATE family efflux protein
MLSRVSNLALNAAGNGGLLYIGLSMLAVGLSAGVQILIARRYGEGKYQEAAAIFVNALPLAFITGAILFLVMLFAEKVVLSNLIHDDALRQSMFNYLDIRLLGFFVYPILLVYNGLHTGMAKTAVLFAVTMAMGLVNLAGDYVFIFGKLGFPAMAEKGAALGSLMSEIAGLAIMLCHARFARHLKILKLREVFKELPLTYSRKILNLSIPLMGQQFLAVSTWTMFYFMVEKMGEEALTISHITRAVYFLAFITLFGISQTTRTLVSTLIAESRQQELIPVIKRLILINLFGVFVLAHGMFLYPEFLASLFGNNPEIIAGTGNVLRFIFGAAVLFCFSSVFINTLEGSGYTRYALWIEVSAITIYSITSYLSIFIYPQPLYVVWMNDYVYFAIIGLSSLFLLIRLPWKHRQI